MRYIICLLVCLALISGCSRTNSNITTITVAAQNDVFTRQAFASAKKRFEAEHPNVRVKQIDVTGSAYYQKLQAMFAGNTAPDVMWMGQGFGAFASKGVLEDLTPYIDQEGEDFIAGLHRGAVETYRRNGKLLGIPYGLNFQLLYYNKDMFDQAGLDYPNANWTKDDVMEAARKLTIMENGKVKVYGLSSRIDKVSYGVRLITDDARHVLVDRPETAEFIKYNYDLQNTYRVSPRGETDQVLGMTQETVFTMRRGAIAAMSDFHLAWVLRNSGGMKWGMTMIPHMGGKKRSVWASTSGFCMSKTCKNKELAWELMKSYISDEFMEDYYPGAIPAKVDVMAKVLKKEKGLPEGAYEAIVESLDYLYFEPRTAGIFEMTYAFGGNVSKVYADDISIPDAIRDSAKRITPLLEK